MTATQTPTIQAETSPAPAGPPAPPPRRRTLLAAALVVIAAAVALTVWLIANGAPSQTGPITPISAPAPPQQAAPGADQADAGTNAGSVDASGAYAQFCQGSPTLCGAPAAPALPEAGYLQFCQGSPTLCGAPSAPKSSNSGYVRFCENSPTLCTKPN